MNSEEGLQELRVELSKLSSRDLQDLKRHFGIRGGGKSKRDIIDAIVDAVENYEISLDEIQAKVEELKQKGSKSRTQVSEFLETLREEVRYWKRDLEMSLKNLSEKIDRINSRVDELTSQVAELKSMLDFDRLDYDSEFKRLERALRELEPKLVEVRDYIVSLKKLKVLGISAETLVKLGGLVVILDRLSDLAKTVYPEKVLEEFYAVVKEEAKKFVEADGTIPIHKVRVAVCKRLGISKSEFDQLLGECFARSWLILDFRSPISGVKGDEFAEIDGRKYYIIRSLKK